MTEAGPKTDVVKIDSAAPTLGRIGVSPVDSSSDATDPRIGTLLKDSYRIERRLGAGGMGAVYLAEHEAIKKKVAIKILDVESNQRAELKERFLREARAAAAITDDHVIAIHDFGDTPDGSVFFAMEYLQGADLSSVIAREAPLPWPRARDIMLQICRALQAAHDRGIVHRDMKPANVFRLDRTDREFVKVLDFGIAKSMHADDNLGGVLTRTGMLFGTPEYMSPEQAQGDRLDHRVDVYAAGVILFELLTGRLPFRADTFMALLNRHMFEAPPRPSEVVPVHIQIPAPAEAVVLKALQKDPALRFQSMTELAEALVAVDAGIAPIVVTEQLRSPRSSGTAMEFRPPDPPAAHPEPRRLWLVVAGIAAVSAAITAGVLLARTPQKPTAPATPPIVAAPPQPLPLPLPVVTPPAPHPSSVVVLRFDTGDITAYIYDESNAVLGSTTDPGGVPLPRSELERQLVLRAPGYEDLRVKVIATDDRTMTAPMTRTRRITPKPEAPKPETPPPPDTTPKPETPPPTPDPPPDPTKAEPSKQDPPPTEPEPRKPPAEPEPDAKKTTKKPG